MISRRKLLKLFGAGTVGAGMIPLSSAVPNVSKETIRNPVLRFAHLTDMHLLPDVSAEEGVKKCIDYILDKEESIDFFVNGGDLIMDALDKTEAETEAQWAVWRKIKAAYPDLKFHHCIGNHDVWGKAPHVEKYPSKAWVLKNMEWKVHIMLLSQMVGISLFWTVPT